MVNVTHVTLRLVFLISSVATNEYARRMVFLRLPGTSANFDGLAETVRDD
jgi:hypothetical protein